MRRGGTRPDSISLRAVRSPSIRCRTGAGEGAAHRPAQVHGLDRRSGDNSLSCFECDATTSAATHMATTRACRLSAPGERQRGRPLRNVVVGADAVRQVIVDSRSGHKLWSPASIADSESAWADGGSPPIQSGAGSSGAGASLGSQTVNAVSIWKSGSSLAASPSHMTSVLVNRASSGGRRRRWTRATLR